jgi:pantetheine-phosphate adenylyltransferase
MAGVVTKRDGRAILCPHAAVSGKDKNLLTPERLGGPSHSGILRPAEQITGGFLEEHFGRDRQRAGRTWRVCPHLKNCRVARIEKVFDVHLEFTSNQVAFGTLESLSHMPGQAPESHPKPGTVAIYPGSFDPLTNGHLDVIARGSKLVDRLIVAVLTNTQKAPLFSVSERLDIIREATGGLPNVTVAGFEGLLVDYAAAQNATVIIRGIRAISDYENELQMALLNRRMRPEIETVFLMASEEYSFVSSRMVREISQLGGDVTSFVPPIVTARLRAKRSPTR